MFPIQLNDVWTELLEQYKDDHRDSRNQLCHSIGIPMIAASIPVGSDAGRLAAGGGHVQCGLGLPVCRASFEGKAIVCR